MNTQIELQPSVLFQLPFQNYGEDFIFIVNSEEFKTSRIISDILSPIICQQHIIDPTILTYSINTKQKGDFSRILELAKFTSQMIPDDELPFVSEVFNQLQNPSIKISSSNFQHEITVENAIELIKKHEKCQLLFSELFELEIEFISKHFNEIIQKHKEGLKQLDIDTLQRIIQSPHLQLKDENQLISMINDFYIENSDYSILYEEVLFSYVDQSQIEYFISIFDINDINMTIWKMISSRLKRKIEPNKEELSKIAKTRYSEESQLIITKSIKQGKSFPYLNDDKFNGILNYLSKESNGKIQNLVNITSSQLHSPAYSPYNVCLYENESNKYFYTSSQLNSWICFDFKDHKIIPSSYIIKSGWHYQNGHHPKKWIVEGFSDFNSQWVKIDERLDCAFLNDLNVIHSFKIDNKTNAQFRYIRIRQTGRNWANSNCLVLGSVEFYGTLI